MIHDPKAWEKMTRKQLIQTMTELFDASDDDSIEVAQSRKRIEELEVQVRRLENQLSERPLTMNQICQLLIAFREEGA